MTNYTKKEPGLVAFYNIRPENEVRLYLQPWSPTLLTCNLKMLTTA